MTSWAFLFPVVVVAITALCLGYDAGVMSGAIGPIQDEFNLSETQKGIAVGCLNIVAAFGALVGGKLADWKGRVPATMVTAALLTLGPIIVCSSGGFAALFLGRVVIGMGVGLSFVIAPIYGAEVSPMHIRAGIVTVTEVLINFGVVLGYLSATILDIPSIGPNVGWRLVTGFAAIPAILTLTSVCFLPETPRWLMQQGRRDDAVASLKRLGSTSEEDLAAELADIDAGIDEGSQEACLLRVLPAEASGSEAIVYYTPTILEQLGLTSETGQNTAAIGVGVAKFVGACAATVSLDVFGRRPGVIVSCSGLAVCLVIIALLPTAAPWPLGFTVLCVYMLFFEIGIAPAAFVLGTECYPVAIRAKGLSMGMFTTRFLSGVISIAFPPIVDAIGLGPCAWFFAAMALLGVAWAFTCVPETKGLSLEDTAKLFEQPPSLALQRDDAAEQAGKAGS